MKWRLVAALVVPGVARAALAAEPPLEAAKPPLEAAEPGPVALPPPASAAASAPTLVAPLLAPTPMLVEPLAPAPEPSGGAPLLAGVLTAFVPFVVGSALWSQSERADLERAGTFVMAAGFAAAPWVSHGLQRRWRRGMRSGGGS